MIKPQPYKLKCPKCNYLKVVSPKSDALSIIDLSSTCPKCGTKMDRDESKNILDEVLGLIKGKFNI